MAAESIHYYDHFDIDPPPRRWTSTMRSYLFTQAWRTSRFFGLSLFAMAIGVTFLARFPGAITAGVAGGTGVLPGFYIRVLAHPDLVVPVCSVT